MPINNRNNNKKVQHKDGKANNKSKKLKSLSKLSQQKDLESKANKNQTKDIKEKENGKVQVSKIKDKNKEIGKVTIAMEVIKTPKMKNYD